MYHFVLWSRYYYYTNIIILFVFCSGENVVPDTTSLFETILGAAVGGITLVIICITIIGTVIYRLKGYKW